MSADNPRIGEKFLDWTDEDPPLDTILESVTLYWLTDTISRSIYPYRQVSSKVGSFAFQCFKPNNCVFVALHPR
jgi:hypothetical protein